VTGSHFQHKLKAYSCNKAWPKYELTYFKLFPSHGRQTRKVLNECRLRWQNFNEVYLTTAYTVWVSSEKVKIIQFL
jgi:hypothetical protein